MEPQQCWHLLVPLAYSLKAVKLLGPRKRSQHCWPKTPNNTQQCWDMLGPFAWASRLIVQYSKTTQLLVSDVQLLFAFCTNQPEVQTNRKHKCALLI